MGPMLSSSFVLFSFLLISLPATLISPPSPRASLQAGVLPLSRQVMPQLPPHEDPTPRYLSPGRSRDADLLTGACCGVPPISQSTMHPPRSDDHHSCPFDSHHVLLLATLTCSASTSCFCCLYSRLLPLCRRLFLCHLWAEHS